MSVCMSSGGNTGIWVNGTSRTLTNNLPAQGFLSAGSTTPRIGNTGEVTTQQYDMYEMLHYEGEMTTTQRQQIEGYLAWKWGLQASLPGSHPYAGAAPMMVATAFSPASMSGLQLWLDASYAPSVAVSGTTVTSWTDRSANARVLGVGSGTTTYGAQAVTITNSYLYVDSPVDLTNVIVFTVFKTNTNAGNQHWIAGKPANGGVSYSSPDGFAITGYPHIPNLSLYGTAGSGLIMASCPTLNTQCLVTWQQTSNSVANGYYNGGVQSATTNPANSRTGTALGFALGAQWNGSAYANLVANASFNEVLVYNTALNTTQRQTIEGYLAWKWSIQASLPAGHPYKTAAPTA